jgi:hypothetical protein
MTSTCGTPATRWQRPLVRFRANEFAVARGLWARGHTVPVAVAPELASPPTTATTVAAPSRAHAAPDSTEAGAPRCEWPSPLMCWQVKLLVFINAIFCVLLIFLFTLTGSLSDLHGFTVPPQKPGPFLKCLSVTTVPFPHCNTQDRGRRRSAVDSLTPSFPTMAVCERDVLDVLGSALGQGFSASLFPAAGAVSHPCLLRHPRPVTLTVPSGPPVPFESSPPSQVTPQIHSSPPPNAPPSFARCHQALW